MGKVPFGGIFKFCKFKVIGEVTFGGIVGICKFIVPNILSNTLSIFLHTCGAGCNGW